jgi:hypothetical protein
MAYAAKTKLEAESVASFLDRVAPPQRQAEARRLVAVFSEVTGFQPRLWTGGMVGFGSYDYTYATGHSGTSLATGFAPRKAELSIYILPGYGAFGDILARLGKHRIGKSCLYVRNLDQIDEAVLRELIAAGLEDLRRHWPVMPT